MYRFAKKYGANVDGYSPIYTPDAWSETGSSYSLGTKGLIAWCVFLLSLYLTSLLCSASLHCFLPRETVCI